MNGDVTTIELGHWQGTVHVVGRQIEKWGATCLCLHCLIVSHWRRIFTCKKLRSPDVATLARAWFGCDYHRLATVATLARAWFGCLEQPSAATKLVRRPSVEPARGGATSAK